MFFVGKAVVNVWLTWTSPRRLETADCKVTRGGAGFRRTFYHDRHFRGFATSSTPLFLVLGFDFWEIVGGSICRSEVEICRGGGQRCSLDRRGAVESTFGVEALGQGQASSFLLLDVCYNTRLRCWFVYFHLPHYIIKTLIVIQSTRLYRRAEAQRDSTIYTSCDLLYKMVH